MSRLLLLAAALAAALTFAGSALAYSALPTTPVFDPQPAYVTPDQEGDGRQVGWTSTFCFGWMCHSQRYGIELTSSPPPPFLGTTETWTVNVPQPADPAFEGELTRHQTWIVHLRAGWSYTVRARGISWITPIWHVPYTAYSEWGSQSFAVPVKLPTRP